LTYKSESQVTYKSESQVTYKSESQVKGSVSHAMEVLVGEQTLEFPSLKTHLLGLLEQIMDEQVPSFEHGGDFCTCFQL
jgi:hypothetical protein